MPRFLSTAIDQTLWQIWVIVIEYNLTGSIHLANEQIWLNQNHIDSIHTDIDSQEKELLPSTGFMPCLNPCYDLFIHGQTITQNIEQNYYYEHPIKIIKEWTTHTPIDNRKNT